VLLRHGRTGHNADGVIQGQLDVGLDDVGRTQADRAGQVLAELAPDVVVSSDLSRARDTAQEVVRRTGVPLRLDPRLRELDLGAWQGLTSQQARERFPDEHAAWRQGRDVARGGGETYLQAGERAAACVAEALLDVPAGGTLLAVTHGGTARAAVAALIELDRDDAWRLAPLGNTCWTVLVEGERGWRLERHNAGLGPVTGVPAGPLPNSAVPGPVGSPVR
jgi:glucosyl-3-phosphoglycerate phosphatase